MELMQDYLNLANQVLNVIVAMLALAIFLVYAPQANWEPVHYALGALIVLFGVLG